MHTQHTALCNRDSCTLLYISILHYMCNETALDLMQCICIKFYYIYNRDNSQLKELIVKYNKNIVYHQSVYHSTRGSTHIIII